MDLIEKIIKSITGLLQAITGVIAAGDRSWRASLLLVLTFAFVIALPVVWWMLMKTTPDICGPSSKEPCVDIHRTADFRALNCRNGIKHDVATLTDEFTLTRDMNTYEARTELDPGQSVQVYDLNAGGEPVAPEHSSDASIRVSFYNLVVKNRVAHARFVWTNGHGDKNEGLYFQSHYMMRNISADVILPAEATMTGKKFDTKDAGAQCIVQKNECTNLFTRDPVLLTWDWTVWDKC